MDANELRTWCMRQPGTIEDFPFGHEVSVFKVAGKMFALSALERTPLEVSVKCEPELAVGLRDSYPAIRPGYHLTNVTGTSRSANSGKPASRSGSISRCTVCEPRDPHRASVKNM